MSATVIEFACGKRTRMKNVDANFVIARLCGTNRSGIDHAAHAFAELCRESTRVELEPANDSRVEQAHWAQEILQVERFVEPQPIENHSCFIRRPAAHRA